MPTPSLFSTLRAVLDHIEGDPQLCGLLQDVYKAFVAPSVAESQSTTAAPPTPETEVQTATASTLSTPTALPIRREPSESIVKLAAALTFRSEPETAAAAAQAGDNALTWTSRQVTDEDLPLIEARCRLKAEGAPLGALPSSAPSQRSRLLHGN